MDDILLLTQRYWTYHVHKLVLTLNKLKEKNLNKILKSFPSENRNGIFWFLGNTLWHKTIDKRIQAIKIVIHQFFENKYVSL